MSIKKSTVTIGNQSLDLPAHSTVPQPTVPLHAPVKYEIQNNYSELSTQKQKNYKSFNTIYNSILTMTRQPDM
jgi:hypothetical protein